MCGRFATTRDAARLAVDLDAIDETGDAAGVGTNYNVAPTNSILTVVQRHDREQPETAALRRVRRMRWGLIPPWSAAAEPGVPAKGKPLFNARADKAATSPAFRDAARRRRCLIPMDGWYEWVVEPDPDTPGKTRKQPYFMSDADGATLYLAGLWSLWRDRNQLDGKPLLSCTILTTDSVGELTGIHPRMPLPMPRAQWTTWLDPDQGVPSELLAPPAESAVAHLIATPVNSLVNNVRNNGPELLTPPKPGPQQGVLPI